MMFSKKDIACTICRYTGKTQHVVKGNLVIEIVLWLMFLIPGVIYSIWRSFSSYDGCPVCKNKNVIPLESTMGQLILNGK